MADGNPEPSPKTVQVILVEGNRPARILMERRVPAEGTLGIAVKDGADFGDAVDDQDADLVLLDVELQAEDGDRPLRLVRASGHGTEIVALGEGESTPENVAELAEGGTYDFLTRPMSAAELRQLAQAAESQPLAVPAKRKRFEVGGRAIIGSGTAITSLLDRAQRVAVGNASILIRGETGTGKSLIARAVHEASSRKDRPFVVVNCSAFQDQLLESELFGHEKGAFTGAVAAKRGLFEVAHTGTLFLDEVAEMTSAMQAKLLQVLDNGELRRVGGTKTQRVDVRIVSATNKDLAAEVKEGNFREDLMFRLDVVSLEVPALRERREDIPELVDHFLSKYRPPGGEPKQLSPAALRLLTDYRWPGNVRELANTIEGLVLLAPGQVIETQDLPPAIRPAAEFELEEADAPLPMTEIERQHVTRALRYTKGKKAPAARLLGIDVKTLANKIKTYKIEI